MKYKSIFLVMMVLIGLTFSACAPSANPHRSRIAKVQESRYPNGITVFMSNRDISKNIGITDARILYDRNKREVQFILNNNSKYIFNLILDSEWSDERGMKISAYPASKEVSLLPNSSVRVILKSPNFRAKDVMIIVKCASNCKQKVKK